jgi:hypothetical protein
MAEADVRTTLSQWLLMDQGRHLLTLVGWLLGLKALSISR